MTIEINDASGINKLLAFLRVNAAGTFHVSPSAKDLMMHAAREFAQQHRIKITVIQSSKSEKIGWTSTGALTGMILGLQFGGIQGAGVGLVIGCVAGYAIANSTMTIEPRADGSAFIELRGSHA